MTHSTGTVSESYERRAQEIAGRMSADELAAHRVWLERECERVDADECQICAEIVRREAA